MMTATATKVRVSAPAGWHGTDVGSWDEAFAYILHHQGQSVAYALSNGWQITEVLADNEMVGRTREGDRIYVSCEIRSLGEGQTTEHRSQAYGMELAFSGVVIRKGGRFEDDGSWIAAGQCVDELNGARGEGRWNSRLTELYLLWKQAHLGGMRALCAHQEDKRDARGGYDLDNIAPCPVSGYRPGSAWLQDPAEVTEAYIERARALVRRISDSMTGTK